MDQLSSKSQFNQKNWLNNQNIYDVYGHNMVKSYFFNPEQANEIKESCKKLVQKDLQKYFDEVLNKKIENQEQKLKIVEKLNNYILNMCKKAYLAQNQNKTKQIFKFLKKNLKARCKYSNFNQYVNQIQQHLLLQKNFQFSHQLNKKDNKNLISIMGIKNKPIKKIRDFLITKNQINQKLSQLKQQFVYLRIPDEYIKRIEHPLHNERLTFYEQIKEYTMNVQNLSMILKLIDESKLYNLLNSVFYLLNQNLQKQSVIKYFELIAIIIQKICKDDFYILIYEICKVLDQKIKMIPQQIKESKDYDKIMMMYYYYRGFSQINFDANHKFYDYLMCKQFFFKINYKKYYKFPLKQLSQNDMDESAYGNFRDEQEKKNNLYVIQHEIKKIYKQTNDENKKTENVDKESQNEKEKSENLDKELQSEEKDKTENVPLLQEKVKKNYCTIKKEQSHKRSKNEMKDIALGFIDFFFQSYIFFRSSKKYFTSKLEDFLEQTLNVYSLNQKFDLGVSQIHKCFVFIKNYHSHQLIKKKCLRVVRKIMKKEGLIDLETKNESQLTQYENFNKQYLEKMLKEIKSIEKLNLLIKYLKQLAEIHIFSKQPIQFLNLQRCISILSEGYKNLNLSESEKNKYQKLSESWYYKYLLYLEQLKWFTLSQQNGSSDSENSDQYDSLIKEIEEDLKTQNETKKLFWDLSYDKMKMRFQKKSVKYLDINLKNDQPILHIRKIMNNIFLEILNQQKEVDTFQILFGVNYCKFKDKLEEYLKSRNEKSNIAYTKSLKFINQPVFLKIYNLEMEPEGLYSYRNYFFVQEVAISIFLRNKQHQKYQQFNESIGYHCFNRYIYHFVQDNKIFFILEYYPMLCQDIMGENNQISQSKKPENQPSLSIDDRGVNFDQSSIPQGIEKLDTSQNYIRSLSQDIRGEDSHFRKKHLFFIILKLEQSLHLQKENCIIHKDFKLLNLAFRNKNEPIIIDYGIAELYLEFSYYMDNSGTQFYKSCQQNKSQPISENTDLTAFIIVIYELIIGKKIMEQDKTVSYYSDHVSKYVVQDLNFMFSKEFLKLIEMICDCQLDTIKSRTKFFIWLKFEIFMNLLYDCLQQQNSVNYQQFYDSVKKAIINTTVFKKKTDLQINFNLQKLINLKDDEVFLMVISLQSNNILQMYQSLLFTVFYQEKMSNYKEVTNQVYSKTKNIQKKDLIEELKVEQINEFIEAYIYNPCYLYKNDCKLEHFQNKILEIAKSKHKIILLQNEKYQFNLQSLRHMFFKIQNQQNDLQKLHFSRTIFLMIFKYAIYQDIFRQITYHMEDLEKAIYKFKQQTCQNIRQAYSKTDLIKEQMEIRIQQNLNQQRSKNIISNSSNTQNTDSQYNQDVIDQNYLQNNSQLPNTQSEISHNIFQNLTTAKKNDSQISNQLESTNESSFLTTQPPFSTQLSFHSTETSSQQQNFENTQFSHNQQNEIVRGEQTTKSTRN